MMLASVETGRPSGQMAGAALYWLTLVFILVVAALASASLGRFHIPLAEVGQIMGRWLSGALSPETMEERILINVRLPRILLAALVGAGLALCGAVLQALFRNPLVSPRVLGLSSGAALGGALTLLVGGSAVMLLAATFASALTALVLVAVISQIAGRTILTIVLAGIVIDALFAAMISLTQYVADPETSLPAIVFWLMGSFSSSSWQKLTENGPVILIAIALLHRLRFRVAVLSMGEEETRSFGINVQISRWLIFTVISVIIGGCVAVSGVIGWVGLVIPHATRLVVGEGHRRFHGTATLFGATFMVVIDTIARTITSAELPLGILTAVIGAPVFIYLLCTRQSRGGMVR
ncbi:FecCD family ABC transporter permease [Brucella sp. C7-11G]